MNCNTLFSVLLVGVVALIGYRLMPPMVEANFTLTLSKSRGNIEKINQPREISATETVAIDRVKLNEKSRFQHKKLGPLGWSEHFFADIVSRFVVEEEGRYRFLVGSDDGFRLAIDGRVLCQYATDRPFRKQSCYQSLGAGEHTLELNYFQGYGNAGLTLEAAKDGEQAPAYWGDDIAGIQYITP
ncbi:PA14 domain-containing protein [Gilvimarinus sp. SDUM040013]|uniref:PA14 domain-containing protein n=1 Tax=Gilvimarinus gilvus TaxID=3058038 RepID=A0ABU4RT55_9GAMM|nr:PA14 domain-containing protein [Gilvimarinus sp. SDUM040013]MDO3388299.1 PA14 domain-containing protein [Gilvimarinus sp. SDUM040013]MDX6847849.1 PA14 domain-containing protein [Gilvimarinus sp. SDUM040013]